MTKLQLTLTDQETALLTGYGNQLGYALPKVARFLLSKAAEEILKQGTVPVYEMSPKTEEAGLAALAEHKAGKTRNIKNIKDFFGKI